MANLITILVILSELVIALISITTAIYGVGLPFLKGRMKAFLLESRIKQKKLKETLEKSLHDEDFMESIKSRIETYEQEEKGMFDQIGFLSMRRAIVYPCTFFGLSLSFSCFFIYLITENIQYIDLFSSQIPTDRICLLIPTLLLFGGIYYLVAILKQIETIALVPEAMPRIKIVGFPKVVGADEEKEIVVKLRNTGNDIARNLRALIYFPVGFEILNNTGQSSYVSTQTRPGLSVVVFERDRVDVRFTVILGTVLVKTPSRLGKYKFFVTFREEKIKYEEETLEIEVKT